MAISLVARTTELLHTDVIVGSVSLTLKTHKKKHTQCERGRGGACKNLTTKKATIIFTKTHSKLKCIPGFNLMRGGPNN